MLNQEDLQFYISILKGVNIADIYRLFKTAKIKKLRAGEIYINEGSTSTKMGRIKSGLIRGYQLKPDGRDVTITLSWENQFVGSYDSIAWQKPSRFIFEAVEDTMLLEIDYKVMQEFADRNAAIGAHRSNIQLRMMEKAIHRIESFVLMSPTERYLNLVQEKPDIVNRVPDKYLATYLGITPVSLSRIRKRIAKGQLH
nr:Crp/Fnr family transcriptional regulator [uncultured Mucilaginibacter sp.]